MKITKSKLTQIIKEEIGKSIEEGDSHEQRPRQGSAQEAIRDAIQMLESEDDVNGTLYYVIKQLESAIKKL